MERKLIAAAVSSALALPMAAQAVEFSVSGHVNRAVISVDGDGNDGSLQFKDANASESRVRFVGSEELDNGITVGVNLEFGVGSDTNGYGGKVVVDPDAKPMDTGFKSSSSDLRVRHKNVYLMTPGGKITLGQTQSTSDNVPYASLNGPSWLAGVTNWCSFASHGNACQSNSKGRQRVLRYDSPAMGPATLAASTGEGNYWDAMVKVAGSAGETSYDLRFGYIGDNDKEDDDRLTFSGAVGFAQGTAVTLGWGSHDIKGADADFTYVALDQSYGDGSIGAYYKRGESGGEEGSLWGVGLGHVVGGGATAYVGFRNMEADGADDVTLVLAGMRVTFN